MCTGSRRALALEARLSAAGGLVVEVPGVALEALCARPAASLAANASLEPSRSAQQAGG